MHPWILVAFEREIRFYGLAYAVTLLVGANIAGFVKVADAMLDQGIV